MVKICGQCQAEKTNFAVQPSRPDGYDYLCKECRKIRDRKYYKTSNGHASMRQANKRYSQTQAAKRSRAKINFKRRRGNGRYSYAKLKARVRGKSWNISKKKYSELISNMCFYCHGPIPLGAIGLDRLDNLKGYNVKNVVPCCPICNYARRDQFTPDEMRRFIGPAIKTIREERRMNGTNNQ